MGEGLCRLSNDVHSGFNLIASTWIPSMGQALLFASKESEPGKLGCLLVPEEAPPSRSFTARLVLFELREIMYYQIHSSSPVVLAS